MDLSEVSAGTPKVLNHYLELLLKPLPSPEIQQFRSAPVTPAKFASHPDIQYFRLVKANYHYAYHKLKSLGPESSLDAISGCSTLFDPYSRELLLQRLRTFNALNWNIPTLALGEEELTELVCAANGWACKSIARNNNTKNRLKCTACGREVILRFNTIGQQPAYALFQFDLEDINHLNNNLKTLYIKQIQESAHDAACSWTKVHTPLAEVYYLTPHISETNEILIGDYLKRLRSFTENLPILLEHSSALQSLCPPESVEQLTGLRDVSNKWLIARYLHDNKENLSIEPEQLCPPWLAWLAAMGWALNIQTFSSQVVLLLICTNCNLRVIVKQPRKQGHDGKTPIVSSSKILSPGTFPSLAPHLSTALSTEMDKKKEMEEEDHDGNYCHKRWCSQVQNVGGVPFYEYFKAMLLALEKNIGPQGEYLLEKDQMLNIDSQNLKRRNSMDINDGIERFAKLRKLYFVD